MAKEIDYSKHEPLRVDSCTVITDLKKFFEAHRATATNYRNKGNKGMEKPYLRRGMIVKKLIEEIDAKKQSK